MTEYSHEELIAIVKRIEKRMGEAKEKADIPNEKLVWTNQVFTILHWELDRILSGVDEK